MDDKPRDTRNTLLALMHITRRDWQIRPRRGQHARLEGGDNYPWPTGRAHHAARCAHLHSIGRESNG